MNDLIAAAAIFSFLAFPPVLLSIKFRTRKPAWWLVALLTVMFILIVWSAVFFAYVGEQERISELLDQKRYDELPEGWDSDGASGIFAVFGGWLVPLAYFLLWLFPYALAVMMRRIFRGGSASNQSKHPDSASAADV